MSKYKVYYKANLIGETVAVSPRKAINNVRYKANMRYAKINEFTVKEIENYARV